MNARSIYPKGMGLLGALRGKRLDNWQLASLVHHSAMLFTTLRSRSLQELSEHDAIRESVIRTFDVFDLYWDGGAKDLEIVERTRIVLLRWAE